LSNPTWVVPKEFCNLEDARKRIAALERELAEARLKVRYAESDAEAARESARANAHGDSLLEKWDTEYQKLWKRFATAQADSEKVLNYAADLLDGFDDGVFVRDVSRDNESGWAIRLIKPVAAMANLRAAIDEARKRDGT